MLLNKHKVLVWEDGMEDSLKSSNADARTIIEEAILWIDMARTQGADGKGRNCLA